METWAGGVLKNPLAPNPYYGDYAGGVLRGVGAQIVHISTSAAYQLYFSGPSGKYITLDWGDGTTPTELELNLTPVSVQHDYSGTSGSKTISMTGDIDEILNIYAYYEANVITNINNWNKLTSLEKIYVYLQNALSDISELSNLANLEYIRMNGNAIVNIPSLIKSAANLEYIRLNGNDIVDISGFSGLVNLTDLLLYGNDIVDISPLSGLTSLDYLDLASNNITDISPIVGLSNLVYLDLQYNNINYVGYTWFTATSGTFYFRNTVDSSTEVDQWLIDLDSDSWANATIHLDGTNPARTSASDAAVSGLTGRGCILHLN